MSENNEINSAMWITSLQHRSEISQAGWDASKLTHGHTNTHTHTHKRRTHTNTHTVNQLIKAAQVIWVTIG